MGQIEHSIIVQTNNELFEEYLKSYITDIQMLLYPYGISLPSRRILNYDIIKEFMIICNKCKNWLIYIDDSYYIQKMIFYCDYVNRSSPYIHFNISFEVQQLLDEIKNIEELYYVKKGTLVP